MLEECRKDLTEGSEDVVSKIEETKKSP